MWRYSHPLPRVVLLSRRVCHYLKWKTFQNIKSLEKMVKFNHLWSLHIFPLDLQAMVMVLRWCHYITDVTVKQQVTFHGTGSILLCLLATIFCLKKAGEWAKRAKQLKVKYKKALLCMLHPKTFCLPPSIPLQETTFLQGSPEFAYQPFLVGLTVKMAVLAASSAHVLAVLYKCLVANTQKRSTPVSGLSCIHSFCSDIWLN